MKTKVMMLSLSAVLLAGAAFAQSIENDDMYFNAKDRAKLKAQTQTEEQAAYSASAKKAQRYQDEDLNPTDSYSARNVNPEYAARSNAQTAKADEADYFISDYKYANASKFNSWNNNFNNVYNNPWYSSTYFGPSIYSWNSPYYGSYYDPYGNPWMNPYYQSGWSSAYSYYMGSNWNYGWGSGFGMSLSYGSPYYYGYGYSPYSSFWGPSFGYGFGSYYGYGYPAVVVVNNGGYYGGGNGETRTVSYGRRATSNGGMVGTVPSSANGRTRPDYVAPSYTSGSRQSYGGRMDTQSRIQRQEDYYNRSYRMQQQQQQLQQQYNSPSRSSDWGGQSHYNSGGRSDFGGGSRSSFGGGSGGGGSFSGSGSHGRTRGRD